MKNRTTIYIEEDLKKDLQKFSIDHDVSFSTLITDVMEGFMMANYHCEDLPYHYPDGGYKGNYEGIY